MDHFQGKNEDCFLLPEQSVHRDDHFIANLTTFEWRSGLKNFCSQNHNFESAPQLNGIDLRLVNFDNHSIFKSLISFWLFMFFVAPPNPGPWMEFGLSLEIEESSKCLSITYKWFHSIIHFQMFPSNYFNISPYFPQGYAGYVVWVAQAMWWIL